MSIKSTKPRLRDNPKLSPLAQAAQRARVNAGLTQTDLARLSGLGLNLVKKVERGETHFRFDRLLALLNFLGLDIATTPLIHKEAAQDEP